MKAESGSSCFQPEEGPSRGLLRVYEPRMELFEALYTTVTAVAGNPAPTISVFNKPLEKGQLSPLPRYKAITVQRDAGDYQLLMR